MSDYTIYHNPRCSKSRETLALLQDKGIKPEVVLYLETDIDAATLKNIVKSLGYTSPRQLMRTKEAIYSELNLSDETLADDQLIGAMLTHRKLIERPIVIKGAKAVLGRPPLNALKLIN
jgi:arsenate reductase (glutaredoxin)